MLTERWESFEQATAQFYKPGAKVALKHAFYCGAYGFSKELEADFSKCKSIEEFQACWERMLSEMRGYFEELRKQTKAQNEHSNDL